MYYCQVVSCSHPGFSSNRGVRKHITNLHPWYYCFDEQQKLEIRESAAENDMTKKPCNLKCRVCPANSEAALKFSALLIAICGGGTSQLQSQQTASRAMKFSKFYAEEDDDLKILCRGRYTFIDFCLGSLKLITSFAESLKSERSLGSSAQLSYLHAIGDLIDFRKANGTTPIFCSILLSPKFI